MTTNSIETVQPKESIPKESEPLPDTLPTLPEDKVGFNTEGLSKKQIYYRKNKERCKSYRRKYRAANIEKINLKNKEKTFCNNCGSLYNKVNKISHFDSDKHRAAVKSNDYIYVRIPLTQKDNVNTT